MHGLEGKTGLEDHYNKLLEGDPGARREGRYRTRAVANGGLRIEQLEDLKAERCMCDKNAHPGCPHKTEKGEESCEDEMPEYSGLWF